MPQNDKWVERWAMRSSSGGDYIVGKDAEGNYGCSCPGWTMHIYCPECHGAVKKAMSQCPQCRCNLERYKPVRHDCWHISQIKVGRGKSIKDAVMDKMRGR